MKDEMQYVWIVIIILILGGIIAGLINKTDMGICLIVLALTIGFFTHLK